MHLGKKNPGKKYYIENGKERVILGVTDSERDLGIIIGKDRVEMEKKSLGGRDFFQRPPAPTLKIFFWVGA